MSSHPHHLELQSRLNSRNKLMMSTRKKLPVILFVDDVLEDVEPLARECQRHAVVSERSFDDVDSTDLDKADLVLVDFNLHDWL